MGTMSRESAVSEDLNAIRSRILGAAFDAFVEHGYQETTTIEIATRAKVSKRELYALVGNKQEMLAACIRSRAQRFRMPVDIPEAKDREGLARALAGIGEVLLREVSDRAVIAVFRLAIAEADRAPEIARSLNEIGRAAARSALRAALSRARAARLVDGKPEEMAERFAALLWGDLMLNLLMRIEEQPLEREIRRRARAAAAALLELYPPRDRDR
jgi:AcrR family transcriptional regulator